MVATANATGSSKVDFIALVSSEQDRTPPRDGGGREVILNMARTTARSLLSISGFYVTALVQVQRTQSGQRKRASAETLRRVRGVLPRIKASLAKGRSVVVNVDDETAWEILWLVDCYAEELLLELESPQDEASRGESIRELQHMGILKHRLEWGLGFAAPFIGPKAWGYPRPRKM